MDHDQDLDLVVADNYAQEVLVVPGSQECREDYSACPLAAGPGARLRQGGERHRLRSPWASSRGLSPSRSPYYSTNLFP
jgi:hypothetical protein